MNYLVLFEVDKSVSHLRNEMVMLNLNNRQINKQLCQNKECIQDHQTYHHHLEKSDDQTSHLTGVETSKAVQAVRLRTI